MSSQFSLVQTRRFGPFFATQFFGAFNDNLFKNALLVLLTFHAVQWTTMKPELLANLAAAIFILPFFLFSATAGQLADKYDKARLTRLVKGLEIVIMVIAGVGFWLHSLAALMFCLFLLGLHSTLFGPVKYAILPQHLPETELVGGNALIEAGTFVAILLGTLVGGLLAGSRNGTLWITLSCLMTALAGYLASRGVPEAPAPAPELVLNPNPITETWRNIGFARQNHTVFLSILGISWFWLFGALFLAQFPAYANNVLGGAESSVTLLLGTFTLGIGVGSLLCERLSGEQVEIGLVPFGSFGLTLFGLDLAFASPHAAAGAHLKMLPLLMAAGTAHVLLDLFLIGFFGGLFIVPLYALVQVRSSSVHRARIIAANNIINALFMVVGAGAAAGFLACGFSIPALFGVAALCNAMVAVYIYGLVPEFLLRFIAWLLIHSVYRLEKQNGEHVPDEGPALLVCEQGSFVDALIVAAACRRPIRFVVAQAELGRPVLSYFFRAGRAIPLVPDAPGLENTLAAVNAALVEGELVCVFATASSDADSPVSALRRALGPVLTGKAVPQIAVALSGLGGGVFARGRLGLRQRLAKIRAFRAVLVAFSLQQISDEGASA